MKSTATLLKKSLALERQDFTALLQASDKGSGKFCAAIVYTVYINR